MPEPPVPLLKVTDLVTGYGRKHTLNGVSLDVARAEVVALIGHNGAGKSTLLKAVFGVLPVWRGEVFLDGQALVRPRPSLLLGAGVSYVPQGNRVFRGLTVRENLEVGGIALRGTAREEAIDRVLGLFPRLRPLLSRWAGTLSGGEKQMLALAAAFLLTPRLVLLDEPCMGLSPPLISEALAHISQINRAYGTAFLIVEQKVRQVLQVAHRAYAFRNGAISFSGPADELKNEERLRAAYL